MKRMRRALPPHQLMPALVALAVLLYGGSAHAVALGISSVNVSQPGASGNVCVSLTTGGQEVAGTQNDLVWDGTCMTLNDGGCFAAGHHGKQVNTRIQNSADFRMRVLVLSLSDVDPIDDGVLYCCNVQGEAPAGSCCNISVVNTGASDSQGNAISGVGGNSGRVCTLGGGGGGGGGAVGSVMGGGGSQAGGSNFGANEGASAGSMGAPAAGSGAEAAPANQVLQGGGAQGPAAVPAGQPAAAVAPLAQAPTPLVPPTRPAGEEPVPAARAPAAAAAPPAQPAAPAPAQPAAPAPALAPATPAATAPAAPPTVPPLAADTPPAAVSTPVPPTKAPASTPTAPLETPTAARGWFGCQIGDGDSSAAPPLALALLLVALAGVRGRRPPLR